MMPTPRKLALLMSLAGFGASLGQAAQARTQLQAVVPIEQLIAAAPRTAGDGDGDGEPAAAVSFVLAADLPTTAAAPSDNAAATPAAMPMPALAPRRPFHRSGDGEQADAAVVEPSYPNEAVTAIPAVSQPPAEPYPSMTSAPELHGHSSHPTAPQAPATHRVGNGLRVRQPKGPPTSLGPWQSISASGGDPKPPDDEAPPGGAGPGLSASGGAAGGDSADGIGRTAAAVAAARSGAEPGRRSGAYMPPGKRLGADSRAWRAGGPDLPAQRDSGTAAGIEVDLDVSRPAGVDVDLGKAVAVDVDLGAAAHVDVDVGRAAGLDLDLSMTAATAIGAGRAAAAAVDAASTAVVDIDLGRAAVVDVDLGMSAAVDVNLGAAAAIDFDLDLSSLTGGAVQPLSAGKSETLRDSSMKPLRVGGAAAGTGPGVVANSGSGVDLHLDLHLDIDLDGSPAPAANAGLRLRSDAATAGRSPAAGGLMPSAMARPAASRPDVSARAPAGSFPFEIASGRAQRDRAVPDSIVMPVEPIFIASDPAGPMPGTMASRLPSASLQSLFSSHEPPRVDPSAAATAVQRQAVPLPSRAALASGAIEPAWPATSALQDRFEPAVEPAHGALGELMAVSESSLDEVRGGFQTDSGLQISFGIERAVYINGSLVPTPPTLNVVEAGGAAGLQVRSLPGGATPGNLALIQNGAGNTFTTGPLSPSAVATVIQNTLDGQSIQSVTKIDATVNSLQMIRSQNFESSLRGAIIDSLRR